MPNINGKAQQDRTYDAIVVGSGYCGEHAETGGFVKPLTRRIIPNNSV